MSASPPKADMVQHNRDVRFVPKADLCDAANSRLFDHLVCEQLDRVGHLDPECLGSFQVDDELEFSCL